MEKKIRIGVIGLGMGWYHCDMYKNMPEAKILALCDSDPARLDAGQKAFGAELKFTKYEDMLKVKELDAVAVATPNFLHKPMTIAALEAGKHVMCEKPMALDAAEAQDMVSAAKSAKKNLMIHFNYRYAPECQFLKKYIDSGNLGSIYYAKTGYLRRRGIPGRQWFTRKDQAGAGALFDIGVHALDLALWFLGHPKILSVSGVTYDKFGYKMNSKNWVFDVDDFGSGFIKMEGGKTLYLETSWAANIQDKRYMTLLGDKAGVQRDGGTTTILAEENGELVDVTPASYPPCINAQKEFVDSIIEGREPAASGEQGLVAMKILDAIAKSSKTGKEVTF
ncbi:gfo/Idh/MocA family oxidoreductase [Candidatus Desantisbacteria bacterium CG02_land_8_20_14_3_00_49_13]|nr:MAG: gfo/Idh/MocA family oxidoreductase [Candidatus Desantisbacteria bacterium CG02_land_8_20_14_3_00_49_13]